ncbi:MAG: hypothetical protein IPJ79_16865 [Bacteroidetes bacterium]|nr:hypothetical protein [Bacteroidota bacterium]
MNFYSLIQPFTNSTIKQSGMIKIGIDIMGGDFAPLETTLGAIAAVKELPPQEVHIVLIGDEKKYSLYLKITE